MNANEIRQTFLDFFQEKGHTIVPSAPLVIKGDPTLMFTNAGMNQFKDIFLGNVEPTNLRVADTQKCLRVSGKHNDLEEVGVDTYHHTMFEMLGNWSFGDYFKAEAIGWAWELLTEVYKIDKENLYVTIFGGDAEDGLQPDEEASALWRRFLPAEKILPFGKKDNFWEMGETGPCGPCSEIHIDLRSADEKAKIPGKDLVNADHPQVIEIWNLVFMQFNRMASGKLLTLPAKHVDTGMGFERLCRAIQKKQSNYDTDVFAPLLKKLEEISGKSYQYGQSKQDIAMRVAADHIRAIAFSIADGQLPGNSGAGYVIRRILRRAVRYGYSFLDISEPFLYKLLPVLGEQMNHQFPELRKQQDLISNVIREEEDSFLRTLARGISRFNDYQSQDKVVNGEFAFELYDTYGFPLDLTQLLANEKGWKVDQNGFDEALKKQKDRSRKATQLSTGDWQEIISADGPTKFLGYEQTSAQVHITRVREIEQKGKKLYQIMLDQTPFYAESGGQVGDKGILTNGNDTIHIIDTQKENNAFVHFATSLPANLEGEFTAQVNEQKRTNTANNHSATHLLHQALRTILGKHVTQKGSLVSPDHLRFDFSHFQKVTNEELREIAHFVNKKIREDLPLNEKRNVPISEALEEGAMALFGEKYGNEVRMIRFGDSVELCGGTHVPATGQIGFFKITSESAVAAGIRRIEALTGEAAELYIDKELDELNEVREKLKAPHNALKAVDNLQQNLQQLQDQIAGFEQEKENRVKREILAGISQPAPHLIIKEVDLDASGMKNIAFQLKNEVPGLMLVLASRQKKPSIAVLIDEGIVKENGLNAVDIVKSLAREIKGGGGGQPFFATAGGKDAGGIDRVLEQAREMLGHLVRAR